MEKVASVMFDVTYTMETVASLMFGVLCSMGTAACIIFGVGRPSWYHKWKRINATHIPVA
jgi:hypothetical protein